MNYDNYKVLVDGMNIAHRVSFIFDHKMHLATEDGAPTGTIYGFLKHMLKLRDRFPGADFYVAWEGRGSVRARQEICPDYKANRKAKEVDLDTIEVAPEGEEADLVIPPLFLQIPKLTEALEILGVHQAAADRFEADDVLGTLANKFEDEGHKVIIVSSDRDLLQVVSDNVVLMTPKEKFYDSNRVAEEYGVGPKDLLTYRCLDGDKSDNLPGLYRFPRKKIAAMVQEHHDLESIYTHREMELTEFQTRTLNEFEEQAFQNRAVMGLRPVEDYELRVGEYDETAIEELCSHLEFESLQDDLKSFPVKTGFVKTGQTNVDILHPASGPTRASQSILD